MAENSVIRARIDEDTKQRATVVLKAIGMTPSDAFRLLMKRVAVEKKFPFEVHVPNRETIEAIEEGRRGGLKKFHSIDELMADLNADD